MPSLFRFLFVVSIIAGIAIGGLYAVATYLEPEPRETTHPVYGVKIENN